MRSGETLPKPAEPLKVHLLFCKNELLVSDCTLQVSVTTMDELIAVASEKLLGAVAAGLGELFISKAMSERLQAAHFELTGKPLTGKLAVPVSALTELQSKPSGAGGDTTGPVPTVSVQIWLRASGWEPLDECRRAVAVSSSSVLLRPPPPSSALRHPPPSSSLAILCADV